MIFFGAAPAAAIQFDAAVPMRFATASALDNYLPTQNCDPSLCSQITSSSPDVYTSDFQAAYWWEVFSAADGEVIAVNAAEPDGTPVANLQLTFHLYLSSCGGSGWTDNYGGLFRGPDGYGDFVTGVNVTCGPVGSWTLGLYDNGNLYSQIPFTLVHNPLGPLGITSPADNQLFQLTGGNYNATGPISFAAGTSTGNPISWTASLHYQSSGGYPNPATDPAPLQFPGATYDYPGYNSIGGQVTATAQTTASDGSAIRDCVTFYVEGPDTGIPDTTITSQLDSLYQQSQGYPTDGTATGNLMTGVAEHESGYHQFLYPDEATANQNPDLFSLYKNFQIDAFWPTENLPTQYAGPGQYIGFMQVPTTDPDAWDWTTNTADAVNLFSGTVSPNKITLAGDYATDIINGAPKSKPPIDGYSGLNPPNGYQLENMALVLYGGYLVPPCGNQPSESCIVNYEYYIPSCSGTQGTIKKQGQTYLTCSTGWQWVTNTTNQLAGINYVSAIRNNLQ